MKRTEITYGQLNKVLRSLGFVDRPGRRSPPGHIYEHTKTGAVIMIPAFEDDEKVFEHHLVAARAELDNFGLAKPSVFEAKLQKAG